MSFKELIQILQEKQASFVLLLCHRSADADAICSAYALQGLLKRFLPNTVVEIGCPQGVNKPAKLLFEHLPITVNLKPNVESAEAIVLLDMNTVDQLDEVADKIRKSPSPKIIIDHHAPSPETLQICKVCMVDEKAAANCELVYRLFCPSRSRAKPQRGKGTICWHSVRYETFCTWLTLRLLRFLLNLSPRE